MHEFISNVVLKDVVIAINLQNFEVFSDMSIAKGNVYLIIGN